MMLFDDLNSEHLLTDSQSFISPICVSSAFFTLYHTQYSYCLLVMFNEGELFVFLFVIPDYCNTTPKLFSKAYCSVSISHRIHSLPKQISLLCLIFGDLKS